jgi:L-aspartate oxidase
MRIESVDYFIAGSGIAGLSAALRMASSGRVLLATKKESAESNSNYAQGGIACVLEPGDTFEQHVADTLDAGAGLCDEAVVRRIVSDGPARIADLERMGVQFSASAESVSGYDLGREGGHTRRRVLHAGDITGRRVESVLLERVLEHPNIVVRERTMVIDAITTRWLGLPGHNRCIGAYLLDEATGEISAVRAPWTVLATGGCGKVYLYTSNPDIATGDGVAIAWRAGADIANMEFIQFHPTCLYHPQAKNFLISEAVRGEGAELVDREGRPFMLKYDSRGALAPRDIVARAIDAEMKRTAAPYCCLDMRSKPRAFIEARFPTLYATALRFGIDMASDLVPVVPAAHYCCGGIQATVAGETTLPGLLAVGECACTGLHGANRLASNSLLEALVCAHALAERVVREPAKRVDVMIPDWQYGHAVVSDERVVVSHNWNEVRTCMWDYVGIVRSGKRLERALRRIANLRREIRQYYFDYWVTPDTLELRNIADVAALIIRSATRRQESRGLHYTLDYPDRSEAVKPTVIAGRRIHTPSAGSHVAPPTGAREGGTR